MLGSSTIEFSDTVHDLGVLLDSDLSMKQHVTKTCQLAYMELKKIAAIRPFLTEDATKTLVSSYILSKLDYCNCVLLGCPSNVIHPFNAYKTQQPVSFANRLGPNPAALF